MRKLKVGSLVSLDGVSRDPKELASVERRQRGVVSLRYGREA